MIDIPDNDKPDKNKGLTEYRCPRCKKLLFKGLFYGLIEIKCDRCKFVINLDVLLRR